jgi:hypothetical protein
LVQWGEEPKLEAKIRNKRVKTPRNPQSKSEYRNPKPQIKHLTPET